MEKEVGGGDHANEKRPLDEETTGTNRNQLLVCQLLAELPEDPRKRLNAITELYRLLRHDVKDALVPAITAVLRRSSDVSYAERIDMASEINEVLMDTRLAIRNPQTSVPATLTVHSPRGDSCAYLRIRDTRAVNDRRGYMSVERMKRDGAPVELVDVSYGSDERGR